MSAMAVTRWALRGTGREFVTAVLAGIGVVLLGMGGAQAMKILFESAIPDADRRTLLELGAALVAATAGALVFDLARAMALLRLSVGAAARLQLGVWDRLLDQGPKFFRAFTAGDLESRVTAVTQIRNTLTVTTLGTVISAVASILNIGLLFSFSPSLTVAALLMSRGLHVTAPVCESVAPTRAMREEVAMDVEAGFVGKTAIHPRQVPVIDAAFRVTAEELAEAERLLADDAAVFQSRGAMCERAPHARWARRVVARASAFGVVGDSGAAVAALRA